MGVYSLLEMGKSLRHKLIWKTKIVLLKFLNGSSTTNFH